MGGLAACVVMLAKGPAPSAAGYSVLRHSIDALYYWLMVPSMVVCVLSGFASMLVHKPYWNALWAWLKGASTMIVLALTIRSQEQALSVSTPAVFGRPLELAEVLSRERSWLWTLLVIALLNVVVGIWRPRFRGLLRSR
jgi:hypothetical protein